MYRYNRCNMGPRGRMAGHRGFRPGVFAGIIGLIFFGWVFIAVIGAFLGAGVMVLSAVAHGLAHLIPRLFSHAFFTRGFIAGLILSLIWYYRTHKRNAAGENAEGKNSGTVDGTAVETEIDEAPVYRTFNG